MEIDNQEDTKSGILPSQTSLKSEVNSNNALLSIVGLSFISLLIVLYAYRGAINSFNSLALVASSKTGAALAKTLTWSPLNTNNPWQRRDSAFAYVWNGEIYMGGGLDATDTFTAGHGEPVYERATYFRDLWKTKDGINWTEITGSSSLPAIRSSSVVEFNGKLYMYDGWGPEIGMNGSIFESSDGVNWKKVIEKAEYIPREGQRVLVANNKLYMFGGVNYFARKTFNDVWESDDALHWRELTASAPWSPRWDHDAAFYKGKFFVAGGMNLNLDGFNDVWYSSDGEKWALATSSATFSPRQGQVLLPYRDTLYLIGGLDARTNAGVGDTWFTKDGKNWQKTVIDGGWTGREDHQVLELNDKLYLFTGMNMDWHWTNDSWIGSISSN